MARKFKSNYAHGKTQTAVRATTMNTIMLQKNFALGMADAAAGHFDPDRVEVRTSGVSGEWAYERGFAFGRQTGITKLDKTNQRRVASHHVRRYVELSRRWPKGLQGEPTNKGGIL